MRLHSRAYSHSWVSRSAAAWSGCGLPWRRSGLLLGSVSKLVVIITCANWQTRAGALALAPSLAAEDFADAGQRLDRLRDDRFAPYGLTRTT
jgi:hypothetical protein